MPCHSAVKSIEALPRCGRRGRQLKSQRAAACCTPKCLADSGPKDEMATTIRTTRRPRPVPKGLKVMSVAGDAIAFVIGASSWFLLHLVGELPAAEALVLALLPVLIAMYGSRFVRPGLAPVFILMGLWLAGQVLTDIYRQTAMRDWLRGDANVIFFAFDLLVLTVLLGRNGRRKVVFITGLAIGSLLVARFDPSQEALAEPWKFGYSSGVITLVALISCYFFQRRRYSIVLLLLAAIACVNLLLNYRSPVLSLFVTIVMVVPVVPERLGRLRLLPRSGTAARLVVLAAMALVAGASAIAAIHFVTAAGLIGTQAQEKNEQQSQSIGGLLIGGRPEILVSSRAVMDSPILGHGSWAKDYKYVEMLTDIEERFGIQEPLEYLEESQEGLIPAHSHLMGAWVQAGILGAIFWAYIFWLTIKGLMRVSILRPPLAPVYAMMLVGFMWSILFSPFANTGRIQAALWIVIILDLLETETPAGGIWERQRRVERVMPRQRGRLPAFEPMKRRLELPKGVEK